MSLAYVDKFLEKTLLPVQNENLQLIMLTALHMADETERAGGGLSIQTCELSTVNFRIPLPVDKTTIPDFMAWSIVNSYRPKLE